MKFCGIMPALVTPLNDDESVRVEAIKPLIDYLCEKGADGFYVGGATGEGLALKTEERMILAEEAKKAIGGRVPMIVQVAAGDYNDAILLAKHAESIGADAISATPPMFFQYDKDDVYNYYKRLAESVHIPMMAYYNPSTGFNFDAKYAARLFEIENVTAIKWTSSNYYEMIKLKDITHGEMNILNGPDEMLLMGLNAGADGGIGSTYNYMLDYIKSVYNCFKSGDIEGAKSWQMRVDRIINVLLNYKVVPASKVVLEEMGFKVGNATFPMTRYTDAEKAKMISEFREAGLPI